MKGQANKTLAILSLFYSRISNGAGGGTRTRTIKDQGILSPRRLPFRHTRNLRQYYRLHREACRRLSSLLLGAIKLCARRREGVQKANFKNASGARLGI